MHFEHIRLLWFLLLIPLMVVIFLLRQRYRRRQMEQFADRAMMGRLQPDLSRRRPAIKLTLLCLAVGFLVVAWANPLMGTTLAEGEQKGIDMAVCIDVSNSMLAQDMKPNRMARSKQVVQSLMSQLGGDRISLVVFAGKAFIEMPLTNDYAATKMFLDDISTDLISEQGTAIGDAIAKGMATLGYGAEGDADTPEWEPNKSRAIIIISDGENHEDDAVEAAKDAADQGIMVCTIGVGSPGGSQIPIVDRRGKIVDWRKDGEGNVVTTHLNEEMLQDIARAGNGIYAHAGNGNAAVEEIVKQIGTLESQKFGASQYNSYKSQFQYPLALALLCLLVEVFLYERRNPRFSLGKFISRKKQVAVFLLLGIALGASAQTPQEPAEKTPQSLYQREKSTVPYDVKHRVAKHRRQATRDGNKALKKKHNSEAVTSYRNALKADSAYAKAQYNAAIAHSRMQQYDTALSYYNHVCQNASSTAKQRADAHYNAGNIYLKQALAVRDTGGYDGQSLHAAIEQYKASLRLQSNSRDAQHNLSLALQLLRPEQGQGGGGGQNQQNQDQNQQNQDQQNQDQQQQQQNQQNQDQQQNQQQQQQQQQPKQDQQDNKQQEQRRREAEQMLNAMKNNEQQTMKAVRMKEADKERRQGRPMRIEKDW